ncbi:MAG: phenylacetate--CoA ligase family protein [Micromonosporaceae bacterium]
MTPTGFWNPSAETLPRERLAAWQWRKLSRALARARQGSKFWATRIPDGVTSLREYVTRVPPVRLPELLAAQAMSPPYGTLPSTDPALGIAYHETGAYHETSGETPLRSFDTARDWAWAVDMWCTALYAAGVRAHHTGCVTSGRGPTVGFWGMRNALARIGCQVVPAGGMDAGARVRLLVERQVEVLGATPAYALRLLDAARELGVDLAADGSLRVIVAGEPVPAPTRRALADGFGARISDVAGLTELATVSSFECDRGSRHIIEGDFVEEVLHPETGHPVGYGEPGVRVTTGLGREGIQIFRYWTGESAVKRPWHECGCGRTWDWYSRRGGEIP